MEWLKFRFRPSIQLALMAILTALVTVLTMLMTIPVPATQGYINLGDVGVLFSGLLLGPLGGLVGGIGSALADVALGYIHYAPITLLVKGLEATIVGVIFYHLKPITQMIPRLIIALILGSLIMVFGYWAAETLLYGFWAALVEILGNVFQVTVGSIIGGIAFLVIQPVLPILQPEKAK